ncbi:MAG TPA: hypothetical protein VGN96_03995 [Roseococcus sp.]|jgi:hypothetical protein|nr:hypothetical protein [Roseococcus sp.]
MADAYTAEELIRARLVAGWTATPLARLRFPNEEYIEHDVAPFASVEVIGGRDVPYIGQPGARLNRMDGVVMLHLMTPIQTGRASIAAMFRNARALLSSAIFGGVYMSGLSLGTGRPTDEDGLYHGSTASAPFFYLYHD